MQMNLCVDERSMRFLRYTQTISNLFVNNTIVTFYQGDWDEHGYDEYKETESKLTSVDDFSESGTNAKKIATR